MLRTMSTLTSVALLSLCAVLVACGGSSGESDTSDENLVVDYSYNTYENPAHTHVWEAVSIRPVVVGLGSNTPTYSVTPGQLPSGLSVNARTGEVSGVVMDGGRLAFNVSLTVQGFNGTVQASVFLDVTPPIFSYDFPTPVVKGAAFRVRQTQSALPPGSQATYSTDDANFPSQLSLDPVTGEISGSLPFAGNYQFFVRCNFDLEGQRAYITTNVQIPVVD